MHATTLLPNEAEFRPLESLSVQETEEARRIVARLAGDTSGRPATPHTVLSRLLRIVEKELADR
jgi:hypothetical protein